MNLTNPELEPLTKDCAPSAKQAHEEVLEVLELYFAALHEADAAKMDQIFHPQGVYATADETPSLIRNKQLYLEVLRQRESPQQRGELRQDQVDSVELAGANTARAMVRCTIGTSNFVDYLTLVRDNNRWQIIAKVFHISH